MNRGVLVNVSSFYDILDVILNMCTEFHLELLEARNLKSPKKTSWSHKLAMYE